MGYIIQYNPEENRRYPTHGTVKGKMIWRILLVAACAALVIFAAKHKDILLKWLLPGDAAVTVAAVREFIGNLREGVTGSQAVTAFYREIITNGEG